MRISDWSSDVCSSDLIPRRSNMGGSRRRGRAGRPARPRRLRLLLHERAAALIERTEGLLGGDGRQRGKIIPFVLRFVRRVHLHQEHVVHVPAVFADRAFAEDRILCRIGLHPRSEEHTSELQSLMRISYAVFCLKKNTEHNYKLYAITIE